LALQMKRLPREAENTETRSDKAPDGAAVSRGSMRLTIEEEILLGALLYPSESLRLLLERFIWQEERCQAAWNSLRTKLGDHALHLSDLLGTLPADTGEWLTHLAL